MANDKDILNTAEIPYEVRMKYIIEAYRKDKERWAKLEAYAKRLEAEVLGLQNILIANGCEDYDCEGGISEPREVILALRAKVKEQEKRMKTLARDLRDSEIDRLKELIEKEYPLRTKRIKWFKDVVRIQRQYIRELQDLLDKNDIVYYPLEPADEHDMEEMETAVDEKAVRIPQDLNRTPRIN